jgi:hypothetical protein
MGLAINKIRYKVMKKIKQLSGVLTWINLFAGSLLFLIGLMATLVSPDMFSSLLFILLTGSVILHSFAAFQLRKSILYPAIPLNKQAPVGLRLMGFMALFFAIMGISNGILTLQHAPETAKEIAKQIKLPVQAKEINFIFLVRAFGIFTILISMCIVTNVALNFRLLKWYLFYRDNEAENKR